MSLRQWVLCKPWKSGRCIIGAFPQVQPVRANWGDSPVLIFQAVKNLVMWKCIWQARAKNSFLLSLITPGAGTWHLWSRLLIWLQRMIKKTGTSFNCRGNFRSVVNGHIQGCFFFSFSFTIFSLRQPHPIRVNEDAHSRRWILTLHYILVL